ncbi:MAG TPA: nitronate monooxygenase, partial [Dongiaceae bacterium]|nr:nitronate monooxygenase [Dongiaceae bacterium]
MNVPTISTKLTEVLRCRYPIICAGMGGPARSELAAAVSNAGGFGQMGMIRETPELIGREIAALRRRTNQSFAVNLVPAVTKPDLFRAELETCLAARVPAMCFFWDVVPEAIAAAKQAGCLVLYQVGNADAAFQAEAAGADIIIAQGVEAGGHVHGRLPLTVLLGQLAGRLKVPLVASGGIASGRGLAAALSLGADGVQCGTAFLVAEESFAHPYHKQRIVEAKAADTVHTDLFAINWPIDSPVRVLRNSVVEEAGGKLWGHDPDAMPRQVIAHDSGAPMHKWDTNSPLRTTTGDLEAMALYAGTGCGEITAIRPAAEIVADMMRDA